MLEGIVEQYHIGSLFLVPTGQQVDTVTSVAVDSYGDIREFLFHLERLVANFPHGGISVGTHKAFALALIATTEHCHLMLVFQ